MPTPPPGAYPPGTQLVVGSHTVVIKNFLSVGGYAHVYVVYMNPPFGSGNQIACLKRVMVPDKIQLNLLRAEVAAMQKLEGHRNIVEYVDSHAARLSTGVGYEVFVLMEYCSGHGLLDFMNQHLRDLLSETQILQISADIAAGIAYMHYQDPPLIHRDLKIENVLISDDGVFKLCDFGSVSPVLRPPRNAQEFQILENDIQNRTTMQYRAPEMIDLTRGFPIDEKSDIWAFGVFVYKLCYYTTPFEKGGDPAILSAKYTFPSTPVFSDRLKRLISVCLSEDPRNRPNIYQILKELSDMRGTSFTLSDIYTSPTSTQRTTQTAATTSATAPLPITSSSSSSGGFLDPAAPSRSLVSVTASISNSNLPLPSDQAQLNSGFNATQPSVVNDQVYITTSSVDSPTDPFSVAASTAGNLQDENELEFGSPEDAASKFPPIEELTLSLNSHTLKQPQQFASNQGAYPKSTPVANANPSGFPQQYLDRNIASSPQPTSSFSSSSPWGVSTATSHVNSASLYPSAAPSNDFSYAQQGTSPVQHAKSFPQASYNQSHTRPQMVSHGTMTSPTISRSHTPSRPINPNTSINLNQHNDRDTYSVDVGVGTDDLSSSSDDEPVVDGTRTVSSIVDSYSPKKQTPFDHPSELKFDVKAASDAYSSHINEQQNMASSRSSEEPRRPRPISMYSSNRQAESLIDTNDDFQPNLPVKKISSRSNSQPSETPQPQQPEVTLIEPIVTGEKDKLKDLLTGLNEKSSTVVLDHDDEYINNSVDFLKALNRETTGRSRHNRSPSNSSLREEPINSYPATSLSNRKSLAHSKKSSVSLKQAVSTKLGDAFKKFDSNRAASFSRTDSSRQAQLANLKKGKHSQSTDNLNTYESDPEEFEYQSKTDRFQPSKGLTRHQSTRVMSNSNRSGSSVQSRIQAFMNSRGDVPPPKTASGYGKYTDVTPKEDLYENDNENKNETKHVSYQPQSYSSANNSSSNQGRGSLELIPNEPTNQGRKSFESALRNSEKIKKMVSNPITVSLSGDSDSINASSTSSLAPVSNEASKPGSNKKHHHFLRHHKNRKSAELQGRRYRDDSDSDSSSSSEGDAEFTQKRSSNGVPGENPVAEARTPLALASGPSQQLQSQHDFHYHTRQLSTISSASSSTEGSPSVQHTGSRKPPKPSKPAHLKSPRQQKDSIDGEQETGDMAGSMMSNLTGSSPSARFNRGISSNLSGNKPSPSSSIPTTPFKPISKIQSADTGATNNSNLIEMSPAQSPVVSSNEDWKKMFDNKYPSIV